VLGATGAVGQMFVRMLADHPWFELKELAASERSAGKKYGEVTRWLEGPSPSQSIMSRRVIACDPGVVSAPIVFSALDAVVAGEIEMAFAQAGKFVLSNAKSFRMEPDVPLVIPEVNGDHLGLLDCQRAKRGWSGAIVTNANCAATVAAVIAHGGKIVQPIGMDAPEITARFSDPAGNVFGLYQEPSGQI